LGYFWVIFELFLSYFGLVLGWFWVGFGLVGKVMLLISNKFLVAAWFLKVPKLMISMGLFELLNLKNSNASGGGG